LISWKTRRVSAAGGGDNSNCRDQAEPRQTNHRPGYSHLGEITYENVSRKGEARTDTDED
jgi:hypothetical protein